MKGIDVKTAIEIAAKHGAKRIGKAALSDACRSGEIKASKDSTGKYIIESEEAVLEFIKTFYTSIPDYETIDTKKYLTILDCLTLARGKGYYTKSSLIAKAAEEGKMDGIIKVRHKGRRTGIVIPKESFLAWLESIDKSIHARFSQGALTKREENRLERMRQRELMAGAEYTNKALAEKRKREKMAEIEEAKRQAKSNPFILRKRQSA